MNIVKLIFCFASMAHVGFASTDLYSLYDQENTVLGNSMPVKRGRAEGKDVSKNKSKPGVVRKPLLDTTNILSDRAVRSRKPNSKYAQEECHAVPKASSKELSERKILKIKRASAKKTTKSDDSLRSPNHVAGVLSDNSGSTTPESGSRTVSVDDVTDDVIDALNTSFGGDDFGFNFDDDIRGDATTTSVSSVIPAIQNTLAQETVTTTAASNVVVPVVPGTPTREDWGVVYRLLGKDATPLGGTYKGCIYAQSDFSPYTGNLMTDPDSPAGQIDFDAYVKGISGEIILF